MKRPLSLLVGAAALLPVLSPGYARAAAVHSYDASSGGNSLTVWTDTLGGRNWTLSGAVLHPTLAVPSAAGGITAAYTRDPAATVSAQAASFQYAEVSVETWVRVGALDADHQIVFESGGGQNGAAILVSSAGVRFLGSAGNVRTVDQVLSLDGLVLTDFLQISYVLGGAADTFDVTVRDIAGTTVTASLTGVNVTHGGNGAGLFRQTGAEVNLGGRTEAAGASPAGLRPFDGEIALVKIHNHALTPAELLDSHHAVLTAVPEPASGIPAVLTLTGLGLRRRRVSRC